MEARNRTTLSFNYNGKWHYFNPTNIFSVRINEDRPVVVTIAVYGSVPESFFYHTYEFNSLEDAKSLFDRIASFI